MTCTPPQEPVFRLDSMAPTRRRRTGLIAAAVAGVVVALTAGTVVWFLARPAARPAAAAPTAAATLTAAGTVVLQRGQFQWNSVEDPTCHGWQGFSDVAIGAQVTVTDAAGKALAIGTLDPGVAGGITTESDGMHRAATCAMPFKVPGLPAGVGPYGVEIAHRGVVRYDEGHLGIIRVGF